MELARVDTKLARVHSRIDTLTARVDDLTRRVDRVELRLMLYSMGGAAAGAVFGAAGTAAAQSLLGL